MIWRSVTCSKLALLGALAAGALRADTISGQIELVRAGHDAVRDGSGVVVWLEPLSGPADPQPHRYRMLQKNKTFTPHVLAISQGSTVDFPNLDPIFHNAFSNFDGQIFDIGLYPPGKSRSVTFRKAGIVRVFCNIHPTMSAVIVVLDSPYFTVTSRDGRYSIPAVPPGYYRLRVFDERATPEALDKLTRQIQATSSPVQIATIRIEQAPFIPVAHLNKYGRPYPRGSGQDSYTIPQ